MSIRLKNAQVSLLNTHTCSLYKTIMYSLTPLHKMRTQKKKNPLNINILSSSLLSPFMCLRERKRAKLAKEYYEGWRDYS